MLERRAEPGPDAWGTNPQRRAFAELLLRSVVKELGWPNGRFISVDDVSVVFWEHVYDTDAHEVLFVAEEFLDRNIDDSEWLALYALTLGEAIDRLLAGPADGGKTT